MSTKSVLSFVVVMMATIVFAVGCQEPTETVSGDGHDHGDHSGCDHDGGHDSGDHSNCDHDHDGHDHASHSDDPDHPPHGPHHGHLFDFDSEEFTGEWCQFQDNDVVRFHLLDSKGESPKPLVVETFLVKPLVGSEDEPFELEAVNVDPEGAASEFMLDELDLRTAIPFGVEIEVIAEGQTLKGQIKAHKAMDH